MKALLIVLVVTAVSGCAVYPAPYGAYGGVQHRSGHAPRTYDQDRDGVPNRYDRDRDGDGVPNRYDSRPSDPRSR